MFEHATLQEAYTGALIAGKGKALNNINIIMERQKFKTEDWARVRFGAGTPWRRCWCVITPPDEKEVQKLQKQIHKKKSAYDRSQAPLLKGDIKFYDSKKTKKAQPIATITEAYSAFAIYPQSKPLIEASTLVKVEGSITIHSHPPSTTEGFVFVMPEVHPAVSGFEMMLRWLFPVFDTFALYGRPGRLIADTTNPQSLMFAMPKHRRYGYLEILDVSGLILEQGSTSWRESEWRRRMKDLTAKRMTAIENGSRTNSRYSSRRSTRNSFGPSRSRIQFDDGASVRSSPSTTWNQNPSMEVPNGSGIPRTDSAPPGPGSFIPPRQPPVSHRRSVSETQGIDLYASQNASNYDGVYETAPTPPPHNIGIGGAPGSGLRYERGTPERVSSDDEYARATPVRELQELAASTSPEPVAPPPAFAHAPGAMPSTKPYQSPELRRANSRMSSATLSQLAGAGGVAATDTAAGERNTTSEDQRRQNMGRYSEDRAQRGVLSDASINEISANHDGLNEGLVAARNPRFSFEQPSPVQPSELDAPILPHQAHFNSLPDSNSDVNKNHSNGVYNQIGETTLESRTYNPSARSKQTSSQLVHASQPSADSTTSTGSRSSQLHSSHGIARKPLPVRTTSLENTASEISPLSTGSFGQQVIDEVAFDKIASPDDIKPNLGDSRFAEPKQSRSRGNSALSSMDDDGESVPDYASTSRASMDTRKSVEKPRAGVMRTVGSVDEQGTGNKPLPPVNIDFGPTMNLTSDRVPGTQSPGPLQSYTSDAPARYGNPAGKASPGPGIIHAGDGVTRPESAGHSRFTTQSFIGPGGHSRNNSSDGRTVAWQPGMSAIGGVGLAKQQGITAEEFVQQRAAASTPLYAHQRQSSANTVGRNSSITPLVHSRSSDLIYQQGHSRNSSADLLQRPGSRGAASALGPMGSGDIASSLSAREQEQIAKMTGQPLISMAQNNRPLTSGGLVGAIEARERDKQQMKAGINSVAVQHAIAQRQQAMYQQYPNQDHRTQTQHDNMGHYAPQYPVQSQVQQQWVQSPSAIFYAQGGGWIPPNPEYSVADQGRQSPSMQQYPQQQYFRQQQQGGQGQGGRGYQQGRP
jgi:CCR4-NOT transcriptional complex subunit CAF120